MRLQATAENWQRWCGRDMAWEIVPGTSGDDRESSIANDRQPCTTDRQRWRRRRTQTGSGLGVRRLEKFVGQVRRCRSVETLVCQNSKLILNSLWWPQLATTQGHSESGSAKNSWKSLLKIWHYESKHLYLKILVFPRTIRNWNSLVENIVTAPSVQSFKDRLRLCHRHHQL